MVEVILDRINTFYWLDDDVVYPYYEFVIKTHNTIRKTTHHCTGYKNA
jgi:hypothetical protein